MSEKDTLFYHTMLCIYNQIIYIFIFFNVYTVKSWTENHSRALSIRRHLSDSVSVYIFSFITCSKYQKYISVYRILQSRRGSDPQMNIYNDRERKKINAYWDICLSLSFFKVGVGIYCNTARDWFFNMQKKHDETSSEKVDTQHIKHLNLKKATHFTEKGLQVLLVRSTSLP